MTDMKHSTLCLVAMLIISAVVATSAARAQSPMAIGFEEAFAPDFERDDARLFRTELALDDGQMAVIESLFADYEEQFDQALTAVRTDFRDVQAMLGSEDPEIDRQREQLREHISDLFEQMQEEIANLPEGASSNEIRAKYEHTVKNIQQQLAGLQGQALTAEQMRKAFDDAAARLTAWNAQKRQMAEKFVADAQAVLRDDQRTRWPALDRLLRRDKTISRGRLQGESVDLFVIVADLKPAPAVQEAIAQPLEAYAAKLDAALRARNDGIQDLQSVMLQAVRDDDRPGLQRALKQLAALRQAVRDVNDDSAQAIATATAGIDEAASTQLVADYRQRGYPMVFRSTQAQRLLKASQEIPGVTPEQAAAAQEMLRQYDVELAQVNERLLQTVRQNEPALYCVREELRMLPPGPEQEETERDRGIDPIQKAMIDRNDLGGRYAQQLEALLGADLYERLPRGTNAPTGGLGTLDGED